MTRKTIHDYHRTISTALLSIVVLCLVTISASAQTTITSSNPFTLGDLVVSQINTNGVTSGNGTSVTLLEFTSTDANQSSAVAQLTLPTIASGINNPFFLTNHSGEGLLHVSGNGLYLTIAGYTTTTPDPSTVAGTTSPRVVATVNGNGTVDTSTLLKSADSSNNIRTAYSPDGTSLYTGGAGGATFGGIWNTQDGNTDSSSIQETRIESAEAAVRDVAVDGSNLYFTTTSGATGVYEISGASLPTSLQTPTLIITHTTKNTAPDGLFVTPGGGTIWVADNGTTNGGLYEYTGSGTSYTAANGGNPFTFSAGTAFIGLTGNSTDLFATTYNNNVTTPVYNLVDYNIANNTFTTLATASAGNEFEGVSFAPNTLASAPEPSSLVSMFLGAGLLGVIIVRRRQKSLPA